MPAQNLVTMQAVPLPLPSPTLTNPDMILPFGNDFRGCSPSPPLQSHRPPSPSQLLRQYQQQHQPKKHPGQPQLRKSKPSPLSSPTIARSPYDTLPNIAEVDTPKKNSHAEYVLASSPTLRNSPPSTMDNWKESHERNLSNSSSLHSEESNRWPGFDFNGDADAETVTSEEEDELLGPLPKVIGNDGEMGQQWLDAQDDEDDPYSSAALSKRAEIILANAKKRLNLMEGNLRGARHSLLVTPSQSLNSLKMASALSSQLSIAQDRDRQIYGGMGYTPPKNGFSLSLVSPSGFSGHTRVFSETSIPSPQTSKLGRNPRPTPKERRSSSALDSFGGPWGTSDSLGISRSTSIRGSRSQEVLRMTRMGSWSSLDERPRGPSRKASVDSRTSRNSLLSLDTLPEDDHSHGLNRSPSVTGNLRQQMDELKGRISSLKQRVKEDGLRRRSLQSLRTPSPFTQAEIWLSSADAYKGSTVSRDAGVGWSNDHSPIDQNKRGISLRSSPLAPDETFGSEQTIESLKPEDVETGTDYQESHYEDAVDSTVLVHEDEVEGGSDEFADDENTDADPIEDKFVDTDTHHDAQSLYESVYEDAMYEPEEVPERHEDRVDAFDYENFFLHSAMGSYSQSRGASSISSGSDDSVATPRPMSPVEPPSESTPTPRGFRHKRAPSTDSISTVNTFATANEENDSENDFDEGESGNEQLDIFTQQTFGGSIFGQPAGQALNAPVERNRPDSAVIIPGGASLSGDESPVDPDNPLSPLPTVNRRASKVVSLLLESTAPDNDTAHPLAEEEKDLVLALATSFQQVCLQLQKADGYDRKVLKRRLDAVRRLLEGDSEDGSF